MEKARSPHAVERRGSDVAVCRARTADRADTACWLLSTLAENDVQGKEQLSIFEHGLRQFGWIIGSNLRIDYRWAAGDADRARKYAAELVVLAPDVIFSTSGTNLPALLQATRSVPIVFVQVADPVGAGFVASMSRPGGNATGFTVFDYGISGKWLELLKEIAPGVTRAIVLRDPVVPAGIGQFGALQSAAPSFGVELTPLDVRDTSEMERAIGAFAAIANGGMVVTGSPISNSSSRYNYCYGGPVSTARCILRSLLRC
jgi:putative tryptophan/tyrosine transport system substrate-binding protein